jgi:hypothetical protein
VVEICRQPSRFPVPAFACTPHRQPEQYARRQPEQTLLYRLITRHLEAWLAEREALGFPLLKA